jgi:D-beta-D-heptose 7-phosphate kinase/D-beta-D-heptose 1-phosphate adenosyltransferase
MTLFTLPFKSARVLCMGDLMLDRFVYGQVDRISPEAPIPVLKITRDFFSLGGAGNVVHNLSALQCQTTFIGSVGQDEAGQTTKILLEKLPQVTAYIIEEGRTPVKSRFIAQSQHILRVDEEVFLPLSSKAVQFIKKTIVDCLATINIIILSDYGKGSLPPDLCQFVIEMAKTQGIPVIVDPKGLNYQQYKGATLVTPNEKELAEVSKHSISSDDDALKAMTVLQQDLEAEAILVTRGSKGMIMLAHSSDSEKGRNEPAIIKATAREVFDVSGAGDTVISTLAMAINSGYGLHDAARIANVAAGIVVGKVGTAVITHSELTTAIFEDHAPATSGIQTLETIKKRVQEWRRQGLTIGFTNGCFDLLHPGHLHTLENCKKVCDRLIVGLNSDASVKRLKGDNRPIQDETVRGYVLAALEWVAGVVVFEDDTPLDLIKTLMPDVLCKGADYALKDIVGADVVYLNGGKVHLIDFKPGYSTTATVAKLQRSA